MRLPHASPRFSAPWFASLLVLLPLTFVVAPVARAEDGAFYVEGGGGITGLLLPAPYAANPATTPGTESHIMAGARYALSRHFEVSVAGFYEPTVTYFHNGSVTVTDLGAFPGTLAHTITRFGAAAGIRYVHGYAFRVVLGMELGWSRRLYSGFDAIDDQNPTAPTSYGLNLPDQTIDNLSLAALAGLEWLGGDHWSLALLPRALVLLGPQPLVGVVVPLSFSWAVYL
jgi:hypothetical protein